MILKVLPFAPPSVEFVGPRHLRFEARTRDTSRFQIRTRDTLSFQTRLTPLDYTKRLLNHLKSPLCYTL